ncbi:MAG TPA: NAD(P)-binding domain-containing protein [Solimonas sp.]|nr:NAD(P)-binding domain-containing protein [Solimonas sp.]
MSPGAEDLPVCIVGAGPAGLAAARALRRLGIAYEQFERHRDVGGIWDLENPGTPMYRSAHFISSRRQSGFFDYPMPDHYPDYPGHRQILEYARAFARDHGLYAAIRFGRAVEQAEPVDDGSWRVRLADGETRRYRALICASGSNWHPYLPRHPGDFAGEIRHSVSYRDPEEFRGRRVLVIGAGNSGCDIACDAAANAEAAFISLRRGYHFIPKHIFGIPADEFAERGPKLPMWLEQRLFGWMLRLMVGRLSRFGLPEPDHRIFESHPILNSQLLHYLQHGDIAARGDVAGFEGGEVVFRDGRRERIDLVLYATGYQWRIPYVPESCFDWDGGRPQLYLTAFSARTRNLFGLGYLETNSSAYTLFDHIAQLIANHLDDQVRRPDRAAAFTQQIREDRTPLHNGLRFVDSPRHKAYIEIAAYKRHIEHLRRQMGWPALVPGYFAALRA